MRKFSAVSILVLLGLVGCAASPTISPAPGNPSSNQGPAGDTAVLAVAATPTLAHFFTQRDTSTPRPAATSRPTLRPSATAAALTPTRTPLPEQAEADIVEETIYADQLNSRWEIVEGMGMEITPAEAEMARGQMALEVKPLQGFGKLVFAVKEDSSPYLRSNVLGFSFWLYSSDYIDVEDLAVSIQGSDLLSYWDANDQFLAVNGEPLFSETRLYFLGLNRSIPPDTWTQIEIWLDDLLYDPDYEYVTGLYIKNDTGYLNTFFVDDVQVIQIEDGADPRPGTQRTPVEKTSQVPTSAPTPTATRTPAESRPSRTALP